MYILDYPKLLLQFDLIWIFSEWYIKLIIKQNHLIYVNIPNQPVNWKSYETINFKFLIFSKYPKYPKFNWYKSNDFSIYFRLRFSLVNLINTYLRLQLCFVGGGFLFFCLNYVFIFIFAYQKSLKLAFKSSADGYKITFMKSIFLFQPFFHPW